MEGNEYRRLYMLLSLPIPLSLCTWVGTIMAVASAGGVNWSEPAQCLQAIVALVTMGVGGTYIISYRLSRKATNRDGKLSLISFLPVFHIVAFIILTVIWHLLNRAFS